MISLYERFLVSSDDYTYKLDDWKNNKVKILLVLGLSGSGKTTLGHGLAKDNNADYFSLDSQFFKPLHKEFKEKHNGEVAKTDKEVFGIIKEINKRFKLLVPKIKKKTVIEGMWPLWLQPKELDKFAIYIMGTSVLMSVYRRHKREGADHNLIRMWDRFLWGSQFNYKSDRRINALKKHLEGLK